MSGRKRLRLGIVGLGTWARNGHIPVYQSPALRDVVEIAALCSRSQQRAEEWSREFSVPAAYSDFDTMLAKAGLDVVAVCTPDGEHTRYACDALDHGCHVLLEKPMATQLEDCRSIMQAGRRAAGSLTILYHKRADSLWAEASRRILSGQYGPLQMGAAWIQNPTTVPVGGYFASDMAHATDPNWFLGTHFYDLLRFMTGLDPVEVRAHRYEQHLREKGFDSVDAYKADFTFDGGATVSLFLSWNLPETSPSLTKQEMRLHFAKGELELDGTRRGFTEDGAGKYAFINPYFFRETPAGPRGYGADFLTEAVHAIHDPQTALAYDWPSLEDAWWASAMANAVAQSALRGKTVTVEPPPFTD